MSRASSHHNWGNLGYRSASWARFFNMIGFTDILDNPDSWEGWHWGATHAYGYYWRLGNPEHYDLLEDALRNTELLISWSNDPDTTHGIYGGTDSAVWRLWLREQGIKTIFIDPFHNYTARARGRQVDRLPSRHHVGPGPGHRLRVARGRHVQQGVRRDPHPRVRGVQEVRARQDDGVPKTPGWAAEICGVAARTIIALAREWASTRTSLAGGTKGGEGGACRQAYATESARHMIFLQAMQGLGKPGISIWGTANGPPYNHTLEFPGYAPGGFNLIAEKPAINPVKQRLYRLTVPDAILNPPITWMGEGFCGNSIEQQFTKFTYPLPGHSEVKMFYRYGGSFLSTMTDTNKWVRMYQSPKLEFVVNQDCWWCNETKMADVILPACTNLERNDISEWASSGGYSLHASGSANHRVIVYQQKCVEPVGESKPDYDIFVELAERLGYEEQFTEGNTFEELDQEDVRLVGHAQVHGLRGLQEEGLLRRPADRGLQADVRPALVRRGPALRHARHEQPQARHRQGPRAGDRTPARSSSSRRASCEHTPDDDERLAPAQVHPQLGRAQSELLQEVPAAAHLAASAVLVPHASRHPRALAL